MIHATLFIPIWENIYKYIWIPKKRVRSNIVFYGLLSRSKDRTYEGLWSFIIIKEPKGYNTANILCNINPTTMFLDNIRREIVSINLVIDGLEKVKS